MCHCHRQQRPNHADHQELWEDSQAGPRHPLVFITINYPALFKFNPQAQPAKRSLPVVKPVSVCLLNWVAWCQPVTPCVQDRVYLKHFFLFKVTGCIPTYSFCAPCLSSMLAQQWFRLALLAACACLAGERKAICCYAALHCCSCSLHKQQRPASNEPLLCAQCLRAHKAAL